MPTSDGLEPGEGPAIIPPNDDGKNDLKFHKCESSETAPNARKLKEILSYETMEEENESSETAEHKDDSDRSLRYPRKTRRVAGGSGIGFEDLVRSTSDVNAEEPKNYIFSSVQRFFRKALLKRNVDGKSHQYYIPPRTKAYGLSRIREFSENNFRQFNMWCHESNFGTVMFIFLIKYFIWIFVFSVLIFLFSLINRPDDEVCITGMHHDENALYDVFTENFEIIFDLSWTTFSTVGYGFVSPTVEHGCNGVRIICAIEAFVGILFTGYYGAVFYSKVMRLQACARVIFSSALCIQYGKGISESPSIIDNSIYNRDSEGNVLNCVEDENGFLPFPVLEFRILNQECNNKRGAIIDASIECYVKKAHVSLCHLATRESDLDVIEESDMVLHEKIPLLKRSFKKMSVATDHNPFFKTVWYVRHVLDGTSPLLKADVRKGISESKTWPNELNDYKSIGGALIKFHKIGVTLKGTSEITACDVFSHYEYSYEDVFIGWQFAGVFFKHKNNKKTNKENHGARVDTYLIHDILPQAGGGNEPLGK